jgi:choline kinase/phosphatidylglycerophosphate synthase
MKVLIIAAGRGSGFNGEAPESHKTLSPVCGLAVIERIVAACALADELVIVTGYQAESLEAQVRKLLGGKLTLSFIHNPQWERANGVSVLAAAEALSGEREFLLTMSDHVFEPALVEKLTSGHPLPGECLLAVDRNLKDVYDLDDATKVKLSGEGRIVQIGKDLTDFDAVDTGVFFCTQALFQALSTAIRHGGESLSDGIRILCENGKMGYRDVTGCMWQDVDDAESLTEARKRVWHVAAKPRDGVVSRLFNRKVSGFITRHICSLPVRPNHVTLFNLLLAAVACWLMAAGQLLAGGIMAQFYSITDGVDGELSRLKHQGSWFGAWLDNLTDRLCDWLIICGAAWSVTHTGESAETAWVLMCLALVSNTCYRTAMDSLLVSGALRKGQQKGGLLARLEKWFHHREMVFGMTHDSYLLILAAGVALGAPLATILALVILETLWWAVKTAQARQAQPSENYLNFLTTNNMDVKDERATRIPELAAR